MAAFLGNALLGIAKLLRRVAQNLSAKDRQRNELLKKWNKENSEHDFRFRYADLNHDSVIVDLGGYKGDWASHMYSRYLCKLYVFEPHPIYFENTNKRFIQNDKIHVFEFGLGASDNEIKLSTDGDSSSAFHSKGNSVTVTIKDYRTFMNSHNLEKIDLMKINIEGGEYDLLEYMIANNLTQNVKHLQIQFHDFVPQAKTRMKDIQKALENTHSLTYSYPFFWENWTRK